MNNFANANYYSVFRINKLPKISQNLNTFLIHLSSPLTTFAPSNKF